MEKDFFTVPQKAVITKDRKMLILKRAPDAHVFPEHWDFPGGKLEHDENPKEGLKREVNEETALEIDAGKPVFVFVEKVHDHSAVIIVYESKFVSGEVKLSNEHTEWKWASKEKIMELKCEPYVKEYLKERD